MKQWNIYWEALQNGYKIGKLQIRVYLIDHIGGKPAGGYWQLEAFDPGIENTENLTEIDTKFYRNTHWMFLI